MKDAMLLKNGHVLRWLLFILLLLWLPRRTTTSHVSLSPESCNSGLELFRAHDMTIYMYMWYIESSGTWLEFPCPTGTNWNTDACECIHNTRLICYLAEPIEGEASKYRLYADSDFSSFTIEDCEDLFPGLEYSGELCQCTWPEDIDFTAGTDPRDPLRPGDMSFNELPLMSKTNIYIEATNIMTIVSDFQAREGLSLRLFDAPIRVPLFHNNDLSECFRFFIRFRVQIAPFNQNGFFVVFTNGGCMENENKLTETMSLLYRPDTQEYKLRFKGSGQIHCTYVAGSSTAWKRVNVVYQYKTAYLFINGKMCGSPLKSLPTTIDFPCPLSIAGRAEVGEDYVEDVSFFGFLDEMVVIRSCCIDNSTLELLQ